MPLKISAKKNLQPNSKTFVRAFLQIYYKVKNKNTSLEYQDNFLQKQEQLKPATKGTLHEILSGTYVNIVNPTVYENHSQTFKKN